jgi:hypothetical protein
MRVTGLDVVRSARARVRYVRVLRCSDVPTKAG